MSDFVVLTPSGYIGKDLHGNIVRHCTFQSALTFPYKEAKELAIKHKGKYIRK